MKSRLLSLALLTMLFCFNQSKSSAQSQFYFKINPYYAIPLNKGVLAEEWVLRYNIAASRIIEDRKVVRTSLGQGFGGNAAIGVFVHDNFGFELDATYLKSDKKVVENTLIYYSDEDVYRHEYLGSYFALTPSVVFQAELRGTLIYSRIGSIFAFPSLTRNSYGSIWNGDKIHQQFKYSGNVSIGYNVTLGLRLAQLKEGVTLFGEFSFSALNFSPKTRETVAYTYNRIDSMSTLTQSDLLVEYSDDYSLWYTENSNGELVDDVDVDSPLQAGSYQLPFSNLAFNIGVKFDLFARRRGQPEEPVLE